MSIAIIGCYGKQPASPSWGAIVYKKFWFFGHPSNEFLN